MAEGPVRTCTGCRSKRGRERMIRITRTGDGIISVDPTGSAPGRGAYVCFDAACVERAYRSGSLGRALRGGRIPDGLREELVAMTKGRNG